MTYYNFYTKKVNIITRFQPIQDIDIKNEKTNNKNKKIKMELWVVCVLIRNPSD